MVAKTCNWCGKEGRAFLFFGKPKGWIKHKTPDAIEMLFCGMACFEAFTYTKPARKLAKREEEYRETKQEALVRAPA